MIYLYKVNSDNYENQLMTIEAYNELRLQMSTGDFHCHTKELLTLDEVDWDTVLTLDQLVDSHEYNLHETECNVDNCNICYSEYLPDNVIEFK